MTIDIGSLLLGALLMWLLVGLNVAGAIHRAEKKRGRLGLAPGLWLITMVMWFDGVEQAINNIAERKSL